MSSPSQLSTADFDYELPSELIASHPAQRRDESRMLVVHRSTGAIEHRRFPDLLEYLEPGDLAVMNDTRVIPARFYSNDGRIEILQIERISDTLWRCMVKPGKRMKPGPFPANWRRHRNGGRDPGGRSSADSF